MRDPDDSEVLRFLALARDVAEVPGVTFHEPDRGKERHAAVLYPINAEPLMAAFCAHAELGAPTPPPSLREGLYPHQAETVRALFERGCGLVCHAMGLGKTLIAVEASRQLMGAGSTIILAPRFTRLTWRRELERAGLLTDPSEWFEARSTKGRMGIPDAARWLFVHYEIVSEWAHVFRWARHKPRVLVVDEAHWVKNPKSLRGKAAQVLRQPHTIALTGTPLPNRPAELWALATLATGPQSWGSHFDFRQRYCGAYRDEYGWKDGAPTLTDELSARLDGYYHRKDAESAGLNLPPLQRSRIAVPLSEADAADVSKTLGGTTYERLYAALLSGAMKEETLKTITRLRKLTSIAKLSSTADHAAAALLQGESVVVFAWLRETAYKLATAIGRRFKDAQPVLVHGGIPQAQRDECVERWQQEGSATPGVIVATLDALKEGVTLTRARNVILHDLSWVPTDVLQAEARVHRISQMLPVISSWAVQDGSIDELILRAFAVKAHAQREVLGFGATSSALEDLGVIDPTDDGFGWLRELADSVAKGFAS